MFSLNQPDLTGGTFPSPHAFKNPNPATHLLSSCQFAKATAFREPGPPSEHARQGRARQAAPACADWGKAASQPTAGRAWLWQNSRNP